ncbi:Chaperone protein focC precursor [Delftia tsuruhatensis]|uniref:fimbrial biogenesis chaperone n=1 Tax=Delftia tsuruhatensis TaxID=180282 RepID=UPI001E7A96E3|nr:fimbria/pilus periplasmic chaperone [Delftia tsuruhatensis]CAB5715400.1 Chaperone protein focC precursor [Delftia tsuruhatensis]CAC9676716.1 Chaperone protein focC precursor [Delftia tsuruhatensis]
MSTNIRSRTIFSVFLGLLFFSLLSHSHAGIILSGTRVIFPSEEKEVTLQMTNDGNEPSLVQVWLDRGNERESPDQLDVPFLLTPTLSRLDPQGQQTLRIIYSGEPLPKDKETLFWLNVLNVPPKDSTGNSHLQIAFRTRIKLMYRPTGLPGKAEETATQLEWAIQSDEQGHPVLRARNPTAYVANLGYIALESQSRNFPVGPGHVLPGETAEFTIKPTTGGEVPPGRFPSGTAVLFSGINDWGDSMDHKTVLP